MVDISHTDLTLGRVLYDNLARLDGVTITYSGTTVAGFEPENAFDWRDFSFFAAEASATTTLDVELPDGGTLDAWSVYCASYSDPATSTINLYAETGAGVFTLLDTVTVQDEPLITLRTVAETTIAAGRRLRYEFVTGPSTLPCRELVAGLRLDFPMGQHEGITPPNLLQGVVVTNVIGENGSILGRDVKRVERKTQIDLNFLEPDWVRTEWEAFATHATRYAFFYQWDPEGYPDEVVFASAESINAPANSSPPGKMAVTMPLYCLAD